MIKKIKIHNKSFEMESDDAYLNAMGNVFEPHITDIFAKLIKKEDVVFDIGANIGMTSLAFSLMASAVYSFEPTPSTFSFLKKNIQRAKVQNVELHNIGLGNENSAMTITFAQNNRSGAFVSNTTKLSEGHITEDIYIQKLDDFATAHNVMPSFIKIDVEGFERSVIEGGINTIMQYKPVVFMEMNHFCLNVLHRISLPDFLDYMLSVFPYLYAIGDNDEIVELHDDTARYSVMYQHVVNNKFQNLVAGFDGNIFKKLTQKNYEEIGLNKKYCTNKNSEGKAFLKSGWSTPESEFTWSDGNTAVIEMPIVDVDMSKDLSLVMSFIPFDKQNATFYIGSNKVKSCLIEQKQEIILNIDNEFIVDNKITIKIELPDAKSPKEMGISEDARKLGLAIESLMLKKKVKVWWKC